MVQPPAGPPPGMKIVVLSGQSDETNARHARTLGAVERRLPRVLRIFPFNLWLGDMRLRRRLRRPLV